MSNHPKSPPTPPDVGGCRSSRPAEMQPSQSPPPPPDVGGCRSSRPAEMQPPQSPLPISGDEVDTLSRPLWPSSKPISLSCRSMIGRNANPLPSRKLLPAISIELSEDLAAPQSRLPSTEVTIGTTPSRYPPWAPPRRHPRRRRGKTTPVSPPLQPPSSAAAERKRKFSYSSGPSTSKIHMKRKKVEASESLSQEEAAEGQLDSDSSFSSPLREPHPPLVPIWTSKSGKVYDGLTNDREVLNMYHQAYQKYLMKQECQAELPTLKSFRTNARIKEGYSLKQKEILINAAKSILSLSANLDGVEINRCSGVILELDATKKSAIILTSGWLICTDKPFDEWSDKKYAPEAKVTVHLLDGTTVDGELLYFSKHYDVAFYEILEGSHLQTLPLEPDLEHGQDLFVLARDRNMDLICKTVQVNYVDPCEYQHNHYMFISGSIPKCGTGGTLVDLNGKIAGMLFDTLPLAAFIPSSLIIKCLGLLRKFGRIFRPQLGLKLATVGFLDIAHIELLCRRYGVTSGLIVGEVSAECFAERVGIRRGDVILSCQGVRISSLAQLEEILLDIGEKHFGKNDQSSEVNVEICVFDVRKGTQRIISLTLELSDGIEVFHSG